MLLALDGVEGLGAATIATAAADVVLFIDIWIQQGTFEKLIVTSSDSTNYPIAGEYRREPDGAFVCSITVG